MKPLGMLKDAFTVVLMSAIILFCVKGCMQAENAHLLEQDKIKKEQGLYIAPADKAVIEIKEAK